MKKKKLEKQFKILKQRVSYLELNCEIREPRYLTFKGYAPLPPLDDPQPSEEEKETLLEQYLRRGTVNRINKAIQKAINQRNTQEGVNGQGGTVRETGND